MVPAIEGECKLVLDGRLQSDLVLLGKALHKRDHGLVVLRRGEGGRGGEREVVIGKGLLLMLTKWCS